RRAVRVGPGVRRVRRRADAEARVGRLHRGAPRERDGRRGDRVAPRGRGAVLPVGAPVRSARAVRRPRGGSRRSGGRGVRRGDRLLRRAGGAPARGGGGGREGGDGGGGRRAARLRDVGPRGVARGTRGGDARRVRVRRHAAGAARRRGTGRAGG